MFHDLEAKWRGSASQSPVHAGQKDEFDQLLATTLNALSCSAAAIFTFAQGRFVRRAVSGSPVAEFIELAGDDIAEDGRGSELPGSATPPSPPSHAMPMPAARVSLAGRAPSCFVVASAFRREPGIEGFLVVVDDQAGRQLSPAQTYVLEAQAAHCATLLALAEARSANSLEDSVSSEQSERLRLLESVAIHARDSIIITEAEPLDLPGPRILYCNAAFEHATGYTAAEVLGQTPRILQGPETSAATRAKLRAAFADWKPVEVELINYRKDGTPFWVELSIVPVADDTGWYTHWVSVQRDITERKAAEELAMRMRVTQIENEVLATEIHERKRVEAELVYTAYHDSLTRLRNRAFFMERLAGAMERQKAAPDQSCAVLFLDLDRFKVVNDSLGHLAGDTLLQEIARRLKTCIRPQDTLARIGGDEFAVLIEDGSELSAATAVAERIIEAIRVPVRLGRQEVFPGCSIGIVRSTARCADPEALLRDADIAMYEAKRAGHGNYAVFDDSMHRHAVAKLTLQTDLRLALENGEFEIAYQPIIALGHGHVAGFEALLRWHHPTRGLISPTEFIAAAEEIGLIRQIDRWVRREACAQLKGWQTAYDRPDLQMSINASATEFAQPAFTAELAALFAELELAPSSVQLEITEGIFLNPTPSVNDTIEEVRRLGVRIALDDFGTGFSSLSYINRYPIDAIKIDKSFVSGMMSNQRTLAVVELIVNLGRTLDVAIIAEGVEVAREEALLTAMGCAYGQGYLFSRPTRADTTEHDVCFTGPDGLKAGEETAVARSRAG